MERLTFVTHSVGIIGGSDGPTAIFIAGNLGAAPFVAAAVILLVLAIGLFLLYKKKK